MRSRLQQWIPQRGRGIHFHHVDLAIVHKRGKDVLKDPWFNKGTAFSRAEKDRLGLCGLLPPRQLSIEQQVRPAIILFLLLYKYSPSNGELCHIMQKQASRFLQMWNLPHMSPMDKWRELTALQDRNETLFYKVVIENISAMAPIVYTPTGLVTKKIVI